MRESSSARYFGRGHRPGPGNWGSGLTSPDSICAAAGIVVAGLSPLTHNTLLAAGIAIMAGGFLINAVVKYAKFRLSKECRLQRKASELAKLIEKAPPPGERRKPFPQDEDPNELIEKLAGLFRQNERLCVIRLHGSDIFEVPPGIGEDAFPEFNQCQRIVDAIRYELKEAPGLGSREKDEVARDLDTAVTLSVRGKGSPDNLRAAVLSTLRQWHLANRLVPLVDAQEAALDRFAEPWLVELLTELGCKYGVFTETSGGPPLPPGSVIQPNAARQYASVILKGWIPEQEFDEFFASLCDAVNNQQGIDRGLLEIRCAVIAAAAKLRVGDEARQRLLRPRSPSPSVPGDPAEEAMLEVRWLIDRQAALIARLRDLSGAFDRLAVSDKVTFAMFSELMRDLKLSEEGTRQLYDWLRSDGFRSARVVDRTEDAISLSKTIRDAGRRWLEDDQQSVAYETARKATQSYYVHAEHDYRRLVLDRTRVPAPGDANWLVPGYAGVHRYESSAWWQNVYAWSDLVGKIDSPADRRDAAVAFTCLFLETWWWYGDQHRPGILDEVLDVARTILRDQPGWLHALEEFNENYILELELRPAAGDNWRRVADALSFLADNLGLRQGGIPSDPVLARIYVCWCFFSGDVAQQTGSLETADAWFGEAARACGDAEDNAAMRLFARYQRADVWIPSDTDRSLRLITETHLDKTADGLHDLSVRAYVARMYGDIRWQETDIDGAFDAYGRAMLLTYVYQVSQELDKLPPSEYTYSLYEEMRELFLRQVGDARESGRASEADAAIERIRKLFRPYWELNRAPTASGADPLAAVVPPLPDKADLGKLNSSYASDAKSMLEQLKDRIAEPADQLLQDPGEWSPAGATRRIDSHARG